MMPNLVYQPSPISAHSSRLFSAEFHQPKIQDVLQVLPLPTHDLGRPQFIQRMDL